MPSSTTNPRRSASPPRARIYHACQSCATSKVKCDGLRAEGCARCRRRKTPCSLAGLPGIEEIGTRRRSAEDTQHRGRRDESHFRQSLPDAFLDLPTTQNLASAPPAPTREIDEMRQRIHTLESAYTGLLTSLPTTTPRSNSSSEITYNLPVPLITPPVTNVNLTPQLLSANPTPPLASALSEGIFIPYRVLDVAGFQKSYTMDPSTLIFDERTRCAVDPEGYPNMITRGHVTRSHVESNFQLFKHRFSLIVPMIPFLLSTRSIPSHPFIILAALAYLQDPLPAAAVSMIEESVLYAMSGAACVEAILALYILTFAPYTPSSEDHIPPTCLRLIGFAYSLGVDLGLESKAEVALGEDGHPEDLVESWSSDKLEELTLWEAVKNRYCILQMETSRCKALPTLYSHRFPRHPSDHINQCISHLQLEANIIEGCRDFVNTIGKIEVLVRYSWPEITVIMALWIETKSHLDSIEGSLDDDQWLLRCTVACLTYSLGFRLGFAFFKPPSPISVTQVEQAEALTALSLIPPSKHLVEEIVPFLMSKSNISNNQDGEISHLPAFLLTTITICLATSRRVTILTKFSVPEPLFDEDLLLKAENFVARQPGLPGKVLREMWTSLSMSLPYKQSQSKTASGSAHEADLSNHNHNNGEDIGESGSGNMNQNDFPPVWSNEEGFNWDIFNFDFLFAENSLIPNPMGSEGENML
ncbi:hypothetical protein V865_003200 [Kwoniella europaea PYCC6329]|uniref:Zn(2)-C6 fungal-type domain-containing protein n=1 Tax=Kwoniella europaea PYCC6329 TaxID=1423913 RepID=A0AAX4KGH8_9TREE